MATINEMFVSVLSEGIKSTKAISDPKDKALACAELAKAIAQTGLVFIPDTASAPTAEVTEEVVAEAKEAIKANKPGKANKPVKAVEKPAPAEEPAEEPVEEVVEEAVADAAPEETPAQEDAAPESSEASAEAEIVDEWTDEMVEMFSAELEVIQGLQEEYEEETIDNCVSDFSQGVYSSIEDISPVNIRGFVEYINVLLNQAEEA